jgi:hypothetical protein
MLKIWVPEWGIGGGKGGQKGKKWEKVVEKGEKWSKVGN